MSGSRTRYDPYHSQPGTSPPAYTASTPNSSTHVPPVERSSLLAGTGPGYGSVNSPGDNEANRFEMAKHSKSSRVYSTILILIIGLLIGHYVPLLFSSISWDHEEMTRDRTRRIWKQEERHHEDLRARMLQESIAWNNEKIVRDAERVRWEADEKSGRDSLTWGELTPSSSCLRYGVREYSAVLSRVPLGFDSIAECRRKPALIHGKELLPTRCDDMAFCGRVVGRWEVDFDQGMCRPWWGWRNDKGCDPNHSGKRRWEAHLDNLHPGDNWKVMCETTPVDIGGISFIGAESCGDWGVKGIWGVWFVPDATC